MQNSKKITLSSTPPDALGFSWDFTFFACIAAAVLFARFLHPAQLPGYYQDDFFYYLKVAQNISANGQSTFNGLNLTNGYHPLWMLALVVLCLLSHGTAFFVALQLVSLLACLITYLCFRSIIAHVASSTMARAGAFALGMASLQMMRYGMEVTLTLPLAALFVYVLFRRGIPATADAAALLGFLASLTILSRLDAGLLIAAVCVAVLPRVIRSRRLPPVLAGFLAGVLPLLILYFAMDWKVFHLLTPVSGLAKQLKTTLLPASQTWHSLLPYDRMKAVIVLPQLLLLLLGFASIPSSLSNRSVGLPVKTISIVLMLFPLLHWTILSIVSDWQMWGWYFYSLTLGCVGAVLVLATGTMRAATVWITSAFGALLIIYSVVYIWQGPNSIAVLNSSRSVAQFIDAHPGVWMMGDQAGTTAYLSHEPIIQMEGLMMDREFLQLIRTSTPLPAVVRRYRGNYYAFFGERNNDGCFYISEPSHAGPTSPKMRGKACTQPIATFSRGDSNIQIIHASAIEEWVTPQEAH